MFPDVLVHRLKMVVDPADSSYMPSLVVVSGKQRDMDHKIFFSVVPFYFDVK